MTAKNKTLLPEVNIGLVGHVDHGKTTLTKALTGKWTDTHSEELKRGITIRLGYADATFYFCSKCKKYTTKEKCKCGRKTKPTRTVSFVDAPGHETLMATVLSGASLMDGALLIIAANETCPQPQTREHLTILDLVGIKKIVVVQNKIDLVTEEEALKNYEQIKNFLKGTVAENAPIIPISAQRKINLDILIQAIEEKISTPKRELNKPPKLLIARSFDINKPGTEIKKLKGGIIGGSLIQGKLKIGDKIEIKPGIKIKDKFEPIFAEIKGLQKLMINLEEVEAGGLIGVSTELDPALTKSDMLAGNVLGLEGKLPPVLDKINLKINLLDRVVGAKEELKVDEIKHRDILMLTVGVIKTVGIVTSATPDKIGIELRRVICADIGDRVAISKQVLNRWRLIGYGEII